MSCVLFRRLRRCFVRLPQRLHHLWLAIVMHALAGLCLAPVVHDQSSPPVLLLVLLGSLVVWVLPWARPRLLAVAAGLLVLAGTGLGITLAIAACARTVLAP
ncbi:MAG: hypothetical protein JNN13_02190 [Planctomycetes bacterium]|nr:hypothetical protein [Planctomycetota bacterium]